MPDLALPDPPLSDAVVQLRPYTDADIPAIVEGCSDPLTALFTRRVPVPYHEQDARDFLAALPGRLADGVEIGLAIDDAGGRYAGGIGLHAFDWEAEVAEIGYWVGPWARGRGVATHAVTLLSRWALAELGLGRLELAAAVDNTASRVVADRAGFGFEGVRRSAYTAKGRRWDLAIYSLVPGDLDGAG